MTEFEKSLPKPFPQAFGEGVIIKPIVKAELETTDSGLIVPEFKSGHQNDKHILKMGIVCHVGPEVDKMIKDPITGITRNVQVGDKVSHPPFSDAGFKLKGLEYYLMSQYDLKGFFPDDEAANTPAGKRPNTKRAAVQKAEATGESQ